MIEFDPRLINKLRTSKKVLVTSHIYPDGDAIGSMLGLTRTLRKNGAIVDLALSTTVGERFLFMLEDETVLTPEELKGSYDIAIILDIGSEDRSGFQDEIRSLGCPRINIDHHETNDSFGDYNAVDTRASSTCEMVYHLIKSAGFILDADVAQGIFLGLVTDSRFFQNSGVRRETFLAAADLMSTGVDYQHIVRHLTQSKQIIDMKVLGLALSNLQCSYQEKIIWTQIRQTELKKIGATYRHAWSAGVFGFLISSESALVAASFIESDDGKVFCEFRSKCNFDVSGIAASLGGGGHRSASGCSVKIPINEFVPTVLAKLESLLEKFDLT